MASGAAVGTIAAEYRPATTATEILSKPRAFRSDIQGLRMVAVVAVVLDHLFAWPTGGFVGVDVFFVISGFLITGLLLREHERSGTISFTGFYKRRVRRIVPAATVVLVVTTFFAFLVFNYGRANATLWDAVWSFFFVSNWHYAAIGTDYFTAGGPVSPLQHFWSLSVEEQFYFVWPWLMLLIFLIGGRAAQWNTRTTRRVVGVAMVLIVVASFTWSMWETSTNPTWAYFSTLSRTWELGLGALLAVAAGFFAGLPAWLRPVLGWIGLVGILASVFLINDSMPFPGPWAAAPVAATALVILAGTGAEQRHLWLLTNRVSGYLGNISYSLYLWHFPVIVLLASVIAPDSVAYVVVALVLMAVLSAGSYHFIEQVVLRSGWLRDVSDKERAENRRERDHRRRRMTRRIDRMGGLRTLQVVGVSVVTVIVAGLVYVSMLPPLPPVSDRTPYAGEAFDTESDSDQAASSTPVNQLSAQLSSALSAQEWPALNPPLDGTVSLRVPQWTEDGCLNVSDANYDRCVYGSTSPSKTAVVLGDSVGLSWMPGLISGLEPLGYEIRPLTLEKCPFGAAQVTSSEDPTGPVYDKCFAHHDWVTQKLAEMQPDLIIVSDSFWGIRRLISGNQDAAAQAEWSEGFSSALSTLPTSSQRIVLMSPPGAKNMAECYTPLSKPSACVTKLLPHWTYVMEAESSAADSQQVAFVDTRDWFCVAGQCPAFVGTTPIYADSAHITTSFSTQLGPVIADELRAQAVID